MFQERKQRANIANRPSVKVLWRPCSLFLESSLTQKWTFLRVLPMSLPSPLTAAATTATFISSVATTHWLLGQAFHTQVSLLLTPDSLACPFYRAANGGEERGLEKLVVCQPCEAQRSSPVAIPSHSVWVCVTSFLLLFWVMLFENSNASHYKVSIKNMPSENDASPTTDTSSSASPPREAGEPVS